jgi:heptosyltransferase I
MSAAGRKPPESILIVMMSAIGDAVHVLPVICALKRAWPETRITWVLQGGPASLVRGHPLVDEILVFERKKGIRAFADIRRQLRQRRFDLLLDLQLSFKAGVITWMSGVPERWGFDWKRSKDLNTLFTNRRIPAHPDQHVQDQYFEFLRALGVEPRPVEWQMGPWPGEEAWQQQFYADLDRPAVPLVIATSNPEKDWVPERWAELVDILHEDFRLQPVLAGGRSPRELHIEEVIRTRARHQPVSTLGVPLRQLVGLLHGAAVTISLDTGPMHMSVALDRPVISLMGFNNPKRIGPYHRFRDLIIDSYGDPGEDYPISRAHRKGRMGRITVTDVVDRLLLWEQRYRNSYGDGLAGTTRRRDPQSE